MASVENLVVLRSREMQSINALLFLAGHIKKVLSFHSRSGHRASRWQGHVAGRDWEFLCTSQKCWDVRMTRGAGVAINLVMHLPIVKFKVASALLKVRSV